MNKPIKTVFAGTPEFSIPYLEGLFTDSNFNIAGIITQPDKPSGRKQELTPSPVKVLAQKNNLPIWQPEKLRRDEDFFKQLQAVKAELLVVVAYGQILPQTVLDLFPLGAINVHPSLLPKYRGASPIQNTILNGDKTTGVSIMLMDAQMDHGPILAQNTIDLTGEETNESLHYELANIGVPLLISTIKDYSSQKIAPLAQDDSQATYCQPITKENGRISWSENADSIKHKIYAFYPWPATWTMLDGQRFKIFPPVEVKKNQGTPGQIAISDDQMEVCCGSGSLILKQVQIEGKKQLPASDFVRGYKIKNNFLQ